MNADKFLTVALFAVTIAVLYSLFVTVLWVISIFGALVKLAFVGLMAYGIYLVLKRLAKELRSDEKLDNVWD